MRLSYTDYINLVVGLYKKKQSDNTLSSLLTRSTPAKIKRECLNVYNERHTKKDDGLLKDFFGPEQPGKPFAQVIKKFETSKFKPLDNYLKGQTEKTDDKNLSLLAWLIDFKHRPYATGMDVLLDEEEVAIVNGTTVPLASFAEPKRKEEEEKKEEGEEAVLENEPVKGFDFKYVIAILLMAVTLLGGAYVIWQDQKPKQISFGNVNASCMYWAGDHYEQAPCNEERKGRLLLPLNGEKMRNFKRITQEDTITDKSIGKVYYIKINGTIEYYTAGGNHPIEVTRTLKPLSTYMFGKYLGNTETGNKGLAPDENLKFINNR